jgi:hypothetical protein
VARLDIRCCKSEAGQGLLAMLQDGLGRVTHATYSVVFGRVKAT